MNHPNAAPQFRRATKSRGRLRLALSGPSGSGKTYTALSVAEALAEKLGGRVALLDTEHGSASKYADRFDFDVLELRGNYSPLWYQQAIEAAAATKQHAVLVIDSLSHAWEGAGGVLDRVDQYATSHRGDNFGGWREMRPEQRALVDAMLATPLHIIVTMRSKHAYDTERDERGKMKVVKLGLKPVQTEGIEYEFDVAGTLDLQHVLTIDKTRAPKLDGAAIEKPGVELADALLEWLAAAPPHGEQPEPAAPTAADEEAGPADESAAPSQDDAAPQPDDPLVTTAQVGRIWKLAKGNPIVTEPPLEDPSDAMLHELVMFLTRHDPGGPVMSLKQLNRSQVERVYDCLTQTSADEALAGRTAAAVTQWIAEQDDIAAVTEAAS